MMQRPDQKMTSKGSISQGLFGDIRRQHSEAHQMNGDTKIPFCIVRKVINRDGCKERAASKGGSKEAMQTASF